MYVPICQFLSLFYHVVEGQRKAEDDVDKDSMGVFDVCDEPYCH